MAEPLSLIESLRTRYFDVTHYVGVYLGCSVYDAVWRINKKNERNITKFYKDLPACEDDCRNMKTALKCFQFKKPEHTFDLESPTTKDYLYSIFKIKKHLGKTPDQKSVIFYCIAGHGMVVAGVQKLLVN